MTSLCKSARQITRVAALRYAKIVLAQQSVGALDMLVRLQFLEGAAGKSLNTWVGVGSTSAVMRGLETARMELGESAHPDWFDTSTVSGLYSAAIQGASGPLKNHPSISADDIVQDMIVGFSTSSRRFGEPVLNVFHSTGLKFRKKITGPPYKFRRLIMQHTRKRAVSTIREQVKQQDKAYTKLGPESTGGYADQAPKGQWDVIWYAIQDVKNPNARKFYDWMDGVVERVVRSEQEQVIVRRYFDEVRSGSGKGALKTVSDELGKDSTYVRGVITRFTKGAAALASKDTKIQSILDDILIQHDFETSQRRASQRVSLRGRVIRLAHVNPELRPVLLPLLQAR